MTRNNETGEHILLDTSFFKALDYFSAIPQLNYTLKVYVYTYAHWMVIHVHFSRSNATKKNGVTFRILKKKNRSSFNIDHRSNKS